MIVQRPLCPTIIFAVAFGLMVPMSCVRVPRAETASEKPAEAETPSKKKARVESPGPETLPQDQWLKTMRMALRVPDPLPPLDAKVLGTFEPAPDIICKRVTYGTQYGMRVPAVLYYPKEIKGKVPAIIVVNGHGGDKYSWYAIYTGLLYAKAGAVVLTFDPTGEGERSRNHEDGTRKHDRLEPVESPDHAELARMQAGLFLGDIMQAVSYLQAQPEVDPKNINAVGYSLGSFLVALVGAVEPRLHCCVIAGGGGFGIPKFSETLPTGSKPSCVQGIPYRTLAKYFKDAPAVIYALHAMRGPTLVVNGTLDWNKKPRTPENIQAFQDTRKRTIALLGSDKGIYDIGKYQENCIHRPNFVTKDVALWLQQHVHFPNWTEDKIKATGETRIGDWATKEKVAIDPMYDKEQLEAGTPALGENFPGIAHDDLNVIPLDEWNKRKDEFNLDSWMKHAQAAIAAQRAGGK